MVPRARRHRAIAFVVVAVVAVAAIGTALCALWPGIEVATERQAHVRLGASELTVTVADTPARRSWGLQGRRRLAVGTGMVFVYAEPTVVMFATKSVDFPIDVVFVGPDRRVTGIATLDRTRTLAPSPSEVSWVVEVPVGWTGRNGVKAGTLFVAPR
jgi:uncharacterized membrane protein (UPF0127 family)